MMEPKTSLNLRPGRAPQLSYAREPWVSGFFSRLRDFLSERPVKVPRGAPGSFGQLQYGSDFLDNLKEWFRPTPPAARRASGGRMLMEWKPWYLTLWEDLRDFVAPPKLPPLKVTSKSVQVRDIWSRNERMKQAQALSLVMHLLFIAIVTAPIISKVVETSTQANTRDVVAIDISDYMLRVPKGPGKMSGGGGGGENNPVPATKGKLPRFFPRQLTPPQPAVRNPNPKLSVEPTLIGPPDIRVPSSNLPNYGDPLAKLITGSGGPGSSGGIGTGSGGGIGSGTGGGLGPGEGGGFGGGVYRAGYDGVGYPVCAYCPDPKFSEEARKAKYQGTVVLNVIITPEGKATNIRVAKGLGLGLDEKAIEAVRSWVFKPAIGPNGKPVAVEVPVEVTFRLL